MIIDCHAHVSAPTELWAYKANLLAARGSHGRGGVQVSDDEIRAAANEKGPWPYGHLDYLKHIHTDLQLISPRPFQMMNSETPTRIVEWFTEETNNIIYRQTQIFPDTFIGVGGLPQPAGLPLETSIPELERCINELGFKGVLINPDPYENRGLKAPPMGDRYWYPLYEKLCELDVVGHIHSTGSLCPRESYSLHFIVEETIAVIGLLNSNVFRDFPDLKILVSHGGGAVPYQAGRFEAQSLRVKGGPRFTDTIRKLYYDTVLYTREALELLIKTVGVDHCLFGAECPGVGSVIDPDTGRTMDDVAPNIHSLEWLTAEEKTRIFSENTRKLFKL